MSNTSSLDDLYAHSICIPQHQIGSRTSSSTTKISGTILRKSRSLAVHKSICLMPPIYFTTVSMLPEARQISILHCAMSLTLR